MHRIQHDIPINCNSSKVFEALTNQKIISQWWLQDSKIVSKVGEVGLFPLSDGSGSIKMLVKNIEPGRSVTWECLEHKHKDWIGTVVKFDIASHSDGGSILKFTHSGWETTDGVFGLVSFFWASLYLRELRLLLSEQEKS